jgi:hypothetical protein
MRNPLIGRILEAAVITSLCGCAASTQSSTATEKADPDCSFRSPTTCWTMSGRFPPVGSEPTTAPVDLVDSSAILASRADSAPNSR